MRTPEKDSLRQALAQMADRRIGVPLWPDAYSPSSNWLHAPQKVISWNQTGAYEITSATGSYTYAKAAPLLIGYLNKRPTIEPANGGLWNVKFDLYEDSPWDCRISPASGYVPTDFIWDPDWTGIDDLSRDQLRKVEIGQGRQVGMAGGDGTARWGQEAGIPLFSRGEIADFLRFWADRQGSVKPFSCPAWCQPSGATSSTPSSYVARFDKDLVEVTYKTPRVGYTKLKLWQEVAVSGGVPQYGPARTYLYIFTWDQYPEVRLTSWEHALSAGGNEYTPSLVGHDQLRRTLSSLGDECNVTCFEGDASNPLKALVAGESERRLTVEILQAIVDSTGAVLNMAQVFAGEVISAETKDSTIIGHAMTQGGRFKRKLPRFFIQKGCNYTLGDACCKIAKSSLAVSGTLSGINTTSTVILTAAPTLPAGYANKWFASGWLDVTGTDGSHHRRAILDCSKSGSLFTLSLNRPLPSSCEGRTATAYPGCSGDYSECSGKFSNSANFGGFPWLPAYLSTSSGNGSTPKAK
jgi:hypothetical protein